MEIKNPTIGIIGGRGKMGTFFRHLFEAEGFKVLIAGRNTETTYLKLCESCDIVIVSVPSDASVEVIDQIIPFLKKDSLLIDFSSLQQNSFQAMKKRNGPFLGIHPLFGPLIKSLEGQTFIFIKGIESPWGNFLKVFFTKKGAKVIYLSTKEHDQQMALIQALIHFVNISLAKTLSNSKIKINPQLSTPVFRLQQMIIGRLFGQDPKLYENITMENSTFQKIMAIYLKNTQNLAEVILKKNRQSFEQIYNQTKKSIGSFISVAENKTSEILYLVDKQPIQFKFDHKVVSKDDAKVAYLGPEGTYSFQAASAVFPNSRNLLPTKTISDVFEAVNSGDADFGVVPSENLIEGAVKDTISGIIDYPIEILAELPLPIHHSLMAKTNNLSRIKSVKSHPQALGQCRQWLNSNLSETTLEAVNSTVSAATELDDETAMIGPEGVAQKYDLQILAKNIGDNPNNVTYFYVVSNKKNDMFGTSITKAILLLSVYDRVGVLRDILDLFASRNLNLSRILSIPTGFKSGEYLFLIDVEIQDKYTQYKDCLEQLKQYCQQIRILGEIG